MLFSHLLTALQLPREILDTGGVRAQRRGRDITPEGRARKPLSHVIPFRKTRVTLYRKVQF